MSSSARRQTDRIPVQFRCRPPVGPSTITTIPFFTDLQNGPAWDTPDGMPTDTLEGRKNPAENLTLANVELTDFLF